MRRKDGQLYGGWGEKCRSSKPNLVRQKPLQFFNYIHLGCTFSIYTYIYTLTIHTLEPLILVQNPIWLHYYLNVSYVGFPSLIMNYKFQKEDSTVQQKHLGFRFPENWVQFPVVHFARCVTLDESFNSAEAKSPHLLNGPNS